MPARAELTLAALGLIQYASADSLRELSDSRGVTPEQSWNVYSLAKALIEPGAVWNQLSGCDRETLVAIDQVRQGDVTSVSPLAQEFCDVEAGVLRPEVAHAIDTFSAEWARAMAAPAHQASSTPVPQAPASADSLSLALPRIIDVLDELHVALDVVATGDISQRTPSAAALAKALGQLAPDVSADWLEAVEWGVWSGLLRHHSGSWWVGEKALDFGSMDRATQLATLVEAWWAAGNEGVLAECRRLADDAHAVTSLVDYLHSRYPLVNAGVLATFVERGQKLGVFTPDGPTVLLGHVVTGANLQDVLGPLMPPPAPGVYPDSVDSVVGAGPLTPEHHKTLSMVARCVRSGMTPRWVIDRDITLATLSHTPSSEVFSQLEAVIIGGIPDSLRAQIADWESRAQSLTLSSDFPGTALHCDDPYLSQLLLVDQKLQTLHLSRVDDHTLSSKRDVEKTRRVLLDGGYPTLPSIAATPSPKVFSTSTPEALPDSWWGQIIASAKDMPRTAVWTEDVLRDAIADRTLLALTIRVGDSQRHMVVEPQSIARGRLRVKDTAADVERTLPLDTIVSMEPAQLFVDKTA